MRVAVDGTNGRILKVEAATCEAAGGLCPLPEPPPLAALCAGLCLKALPFFLPTVVELNVDLIRCRRLAGVAEHGADSRPTRSSVPVEVHFGAVVDAHQARRPKHPILVGVSIPILGGHWTHDDPTRDVITKFGAPGEVPPLVPLVPPALKGPVSGIIEKLGAGGYSLLRLVPLALNVPAGSVDVSVHLPTVSADGGRINLPRCGRCLMGRLSQPGPEPLMCVWRNLGGQPVAWTWPQGEVLWCGGSPVLMSDPLALSNPFAELLVFGPIVRSAVVEHRWFHGDARQRWADRTYRELQAWRIAGVGLGLLFAKEAAFAALDGAAWLWPVLGCAVGLERHHNWMWAIQTLGLHFTEAFKSALITSL